MLGVQLHHLGQGVCPVALGLAGQAVDQIHAHVVKAGPSGIEYRPLGLLEIVPASDQLQQIVVRRLHPQGDPVHALLPQQLQRVETDAVRVALHCHLRVGADVAVELQGVENVHDPVRPVKAGSAAAEIDAVHLVLLDGRSGLLQMVQ